jgi:DNA-binding CsgD family transcriptional regulator
VKPPRYWKLPQHLSTEALRHAQGLALPLAQVSSLLQKLGLSGRHAVAEDLLHIVSAQVPMAQCTIFSYEGQSPPKVVAVGDRSRTSALRSITHDYVTRFHLLDASREVMQAELEPARRATAAHPHILLHRQGPQDIAHTEYRRICYELPQVAERLAILALYDGWRWLSVNLYRGTEHGPLDDAAMAMLEALAPLIVHAVRLHYAGHLFDEDLAEWLLTRLHRRHPLLTKRDLDVLRSLLAGQSTELLAQNLGLELSSAHTYLKRIWRKLGINGQRELLGLLVQPDGKEHGLSPFGDMRWAGRS